MIAGSGVWWSGAEAALQAFIERTQIPLYTITMARGTVSDDHPLSMGYADPALNHAVHTVFREADLFIVVGKRIDYRLAMGGARLFRPDANSSRSIFTRRNSASIAASMSPSAPTPSPPSTALIAAAGGKPWSPLPWLDHLRDLRAQWETCLAECEDDNSPLHPRRLLRELKTALPRTSSTPGTAAISRIGAARPSLPRTRRVAAPRPARHRDGSALPNGLALQLAHPGKPVAVITGDGSLGFYIAEMDTAVRHKLPIVMIVGNDAGWGLERELQGAGHRPPIPSRASSAGRATTSS